MLHLDEDLQIFFIFFSFEFVPVSQFFLSAGYVSSFSAFVFLIPVLSTVVSSTAIRFYGRRITERTQCESMLSFTPLLFRLITEQLWGRWGWHVFFVSTSVV